MGGRQLGGHWAAAYYTSPYKSIHTLFVVPLQRTKPRYRNDSA
jgi:hypothetical protein